MAETVKQLYSLTYYTLLCGNNGYKMQYLSLINLGSLWFQLQTVEMLSKGNFMQNISLATQPRKFN